MIPALLHSSPYLATLLLCLLAVRPLSRSSWTWRMPALGILLWQLLALSLLLSAAGLCLAAGLAPSPGGEFWALTRLGSALLAGDSPAWLGPGHLIAVALGMAFPAAATALLVWHYTGLARVRRRHRAMLALVSDPYPSDPSVRVLPHPGPLAYCLPGRRGSVVVSSGFLDLLDQGQLATVLAHELAHKRERHDLVLLPFAAMRRALPRSAVVSRAHQAVSLLVEMRADDRALRVYSTQDLSSALHMVGAASASGAAGTTGPAGSGSPLGGGPALRGSGLAFRGGGLALRGGDIDARLQRIADPPPLRRSRLAAALSLATVALATLCSHYLMPW